jgi:hypothetical protein
LVAKGNVWEIICGGIVIVVIKYFVLSVLMMVLLKIMETLVNFVRNVGIIKQYFQKKYIEKMSHLLEINLDEAIQILIKRQTDKVDRENENLCKLKTSVLTQRKELIDFYRTYYSYMGLMEPKQTEYYKKKNELIKEFDEKNGICGKDYF